MFYRIRFAKYGVVKFIGHLDVMRYFQKAIRRSELLIKYSQGYSPHQLLVFASPLGVGITSDGEYMDIEVEDDAPEILRAYEEVTGGSAADGKTVNALDDDGLTAVGSASARYVSETISKALTEGFEILECRYIFSREGGKRPENAMSQVNGADYLVSLKDGYSLKGADGEKWQSFMAQSTVNVVKKTKSGEKELDIRPYIYASAFGRKDAGMLSDAAGLKHADTFENDNVIFMRLAAGSAVNIKPELVTEAFCGFIGAEYNENAFQIHRVKMYASAEELKAL